MQSIANDTLNRIITYTTCWTANSAFSLLFIHCLFLQWANSAAC